MTTRPSELVMLPDPDPPFRLPDIPLVRDLLAELLLAAETRRKERDTLPDGRVVRSA